MKPREAAGSPSLLRFRFYRPEQRASLAAFMTCLGVVGSRDGTFAGQLDRV